MSSIKKITAIFLVALISFVVLPVFPVQAAEDEFTLTVPVMEHGNITVKNTYKRSSQENNTYIYVFEKDAEVVLTFEANSGYSLGSVKLNNVPIQTNNNKYSFNIDSDMSLTAEFKPNLNIQVDKVFEGITAVDGVVIKVNGNTVGSYFECAYGTESELSVTVPSGYSAQSASIQSGGETKPIPLTGNKGTIPALTAEGTLTVTIIKSSGLTVTINCGSGGKASVSNTKPSINENITFTFVPDAGYVVDKVTKSGFDVTSSVKNNTYTTSATADIILDVTFKLPDKKISLKVDSAANYGSVEFDAYPNDSSITVKHGENVKINFKPNENYEISEVFINNNKKDDVKNNSVTIAVTQDTEVVVSYKKVSYKLTVSVIDLNTGDISADGYQIDNSIKSNIIQVEHGSDVTFTFTPYLDYEISYVTVNDKTVTVTNNKYTIKNVTASSVIKVKFKRAGEETKNYTVTPTAGEGGTISPNETRSYPEGQSPTFTISPSAGYTVDYVEVNGTNVNLTNGQYTISNIDKDYTIKAYFKKTSGGTSGVVKVDDVNWSNDEITIDLSGTTVVDKAVLDKITNECKTKQVIFKGSDFEIKLPLSTIFTTTDYSTYDLAILKNSSQNSDTISSQIKSKYGETDYSIISVNSIFPRNSEITVSIGKAFANMVVYYYNYTSEGGEISLVDDNVTVDSSGSVSVEYTQLGEMVFILNPEGVAEHKVNVTVGENGSVTPAENEFTAKHGQIIEFEIKADKGYIISSVLINGEEILDPTQKLESTTYKLTVEGETNVVFEFVKSEDGGSNAGLIIAIVIIALALIGGGVWFFIKWKQTKF